MRNTIYASLLVLFLLAAICTALPAPVNLNADYSARRNSVKLSWSQAPGASAYNVYRKEVSDTSFTRINFSPVSSRSFEDRNLSKGKDLLYTVRAVDASGNESADSKIVGSPQMSINVQAVVTTNRDKPLSSRSIRTGKLVTFAGPGDMITYRISYFNRGVSSAKNVNINYDIPQGTEIAGPVLVRKGPSAQISYFDRSLAKWVPQIVKAGNISKIKVFIPEAVPPLYDSKEANGRIDLNVVIAL